jgi:uncharacterized small protein (DUF1192 family)
MQADANGSSNNQAFLDPGEIFEIRDPQVDVEALMRTVRENVARRRADGAYSEDLDAIADEVFAQAMAGQVTSLIAGGDVHDLAASIAELNARWMVREVPFTSNVPLFGPLIVAVRKAWNWMSTKWYVRPIVQQQVGFNALVVRALNESMAIQKELTEKVPQLQAEVAVLREEIERLQATDTVADD